MCTTELGYMAKIKPEFDKRNVKIIGLSVDPTDRHEAWADDIEETQGARPNYPIIGDADFNVSKLYDMLPGRDVGRSAARTPADNQTVRNVFVIGPDKKIKLILVYPMTTGRNFDEVLRVIDSLQLTAKHRVATPVNWKQGEDVIIAGSVSDDEAKTIFPDGWKAPKPYIRIVPQPQLRAEPTRTTDSTIRASWSRPTPARAGRGGRGGRPGSARTIVALIGTLTRSASTTTGSAPRRRASSCDVGVARADDVGPARTASARGTGRSTAATVPRRRSRSAGRGRPRPLSTSGCSSASQPRASEPGAASAGPLLTNTASASHRAAASLDQVRVAEVRRVEPPDDNRGHGTRAVGRDPARGTARRGPRPRS